MSADESMSLLEQIRIQGAVIRKLKAAIDVCTDEKFLLKSIYTLSIAQGKLSEMQRVLAGVSRRGRVKTVTDFPTKTESPS